MLRRSSRHGLLRPTRALAASLCFMVGLITGGCSFVGTLSPKDSMVKNYFANGMKALEEPRNLPMAERCFKDALRLQPLFVPAQSHLGYVYHLKNQHDRALVELENAAENYPDYADTYNYLGLVYWKGKSDHAKAQEYFLLAVETYPGYDEALYHLGLLAEEQHHYAQALGYYLQTVDANSAYAPAHISAGLIYLRNGRYDDAKEHFEIATDVAPKNAQAHYGLGRIKLAKELWTDAIAHLLAAAKLDETDAQISKALTHTLRKAPDNVAKHFTRLASTELEKENPKERSLELVMGYLKVARQIDPKLIDVPILYSRGFLELGKLEEAGQWAARAYKLDKRNHDVHFMLGLLNLQRARKDSKKAKPYYDKAIKHLGWLCRQRSKNLKYHNYLGVAFFGRQHHRKAERVWLRALTLEGSDKLKEQIVANLAQLMKQPQFKRASDLNKEGEGFLTRKLYEGAKDKFRGAITHDHEYALAYANLAVAELELGNLVEAERHAMLAIARDDDLAPAYVVRARVALRKEEYEEADKLLKEAVERDDNLVDAPYYQAVIAEVVGNEALARRYLKEAMVINPKHEPSLLLLAKLYHKQGNYPQAEDMLKLALDINPNNIESFMQLGQLYREKNELAAAQQAFEEGHSVDDNDPRPWQGLAEVQQQRGNGDMAGQLFLEAASRFLAVSQYDNALASARKARAQSPDLGAAYLLGAEALDRMGSSSEARSWLHDATKLDDGRFVKAHFQLALHYHKANDFDKAAVYYRNVIKLNEDNYFAIENLASLYREGLEEPVSRREAIELLRDAHGLDPRPEKKAEIKRLLEELQR